MDDRFSRTELLVGKEGMERLFSARVAVFGIGGVGGYAVEALARSGVRNLTLIDSDTVSVSNINRQIIATSKTVGKYKTEAARERVLDINPDANVTIYNVFYSKENKDSFDLSEYDYVIDAIDSISAKTELIVAATEANTPIISSMGAGNKLCPTEFKVADIYKTSVCPLARVMRRELKARGVKKLKVVYSEELPLKAVVEEDKTRHAPGSIAFVPSVAGLILASEVIKDIINKEQ